MRWGEVCVVRARLDVGEDADEDGIVLIAIGVTGVG